MIMEKKPTVARAFGRGVLNSLRRNDSWTREELLGLVILAGLALLVGVLVRPSVERAYVQTAANCVTTLPGFATCMDQAGYGKGSFNLSVVHLLAIKELGQ
jgi:hypothetical protein